MTALGSFASFPECEREVRSTPNSGHSAGDQDSVEFKHPRAHLGGRPSSASALMLSAKLSAAALPVYRLRLSVAGRRRNPRTRFSRPARIWIRATLTRANVFLKVSRPAGPETSRTRTGAVRCGSSHYNPTWRHVALAISPDLVRAATTRQATGGRIAEEKYSVPARANGVGPAANPESPKLSRKPARCRVGDGARSSASSSSSGCHYASPLFGQGQSSPSRARTHRGERTGLAGPALSLTTARSRALVTLVRDLPVRFATRYG
jgi:hypothetical protein